MKEYTGRVRVTTADMRHDAEAQIRVEPDCIVAVYAESEDTLAGTTTTLTVQWGEDSRQPSVSVERHGETMSAYTFALGNPVPGYYEFPQGRLDLTMETRVLDVALAGSVLRAHIASVMRIAEVEEAQLRIELTIDWNAL